MAFEVTCVTIDDGSDYDDCRCIKTIGYETILGSHERTPAQMHDKIQGGTEFYIDHYGSKTDLVAAEQNGTKYVRTEPNDTEDDNLLEQPSC